MAHLRQLMLAVSAIALLAGCSGGGGGGTSSQNPQPVSPPPPPPPPPPSPPPPPPPPAVPADQTNVVYGSGLLETGTKPLTLDVYQSGEPCTQPRPFVMLVHGGEFDSGEKSDAPWPDIAQSLTDQDYTVISIDYRLSSDAPVPSAEFHPLRDAILASGETGITGTDTDAQADILASAIEDGTSALRWVEDHQDELCVDASQFAIWGESSGAIIALHLAYGLDEYAIYSPQPDVLVDYWGRFIYGGLISGSDAPLLILHGDQDPVIDYGYALDIQAEAEAASVPYAFYTVTDGGHGFAGIEENALTADGVTLRQHAFDFITSHLRDGPSVYETRKISASSPPPPAPPPPAPPPPAPPPPAPPSPAPPPPAPPPPAPPPPAPPPPAPPVPASASDVIYGTGLTAAGTKDLKLDVYQTGEACTDLRPFVMLIHGGGFEEGSKSMSPWRSLAGDITDLGYTAISIDYRMIGDRPRPSAEFEPVRNDILASGLGPLITYDLHQQADVIASAIEDSVTALRWVEANQEDLCVDMSRFAVWGDSAGAVMGLHAAYGMDEYDIPVPEPDVVIDYWGRFIYGSNLMAAGDPPPFILHGTQDEVVNYSFALDIRNQANAARIPYAFYTVTGAKHGFEGIPIDTLTVNGRTLRQLTIDYIADHLEDDGSPGYETHSIPR